MKIVTLITPRALTSLGIMLMKFGKENFDKILLEKVTYE